MRRTHIHTLIMRFFARLRTRVRHIGFGRRARRNILESQLPRRLYILQLDHEVLGNLAVDLVEVPPLL